MKIKHLFLSLFFFSTIFAIPKAVGSPELTIIFEKYYSDPNEIPAGGVPSERLSPPLTPKKFRDLRHLKALILKTTEKSKLFRDLKAEDLNAIIYNGKHIADVRTLNEDLGQQEDLDITVIVK